VLFRSEDALWFFASLKALVRVEVAIHRTLQLEPGFRRDVVIDIGRAHLALAQRLAWRAHRPTVVVVGGLSGSGKTALSTQLEERWGFKRVGSDETRKQLVGVGLDEHAPDHAYENYVSEVVYERLGNAAADALASGRSAVIDATFRRQADSAHFLAALSRRGHEDGELPLVSLELKAHPDVLRTRIGDRAERGGSDAGIAVLESQIAERDSAREQLLPGSVTIDTSAPIEAVLTEVEVAVLNRLRPEGLGPPAPR
jgi:predicted kinase